MIEELITYLRKNTPYNYCFDGTSTLKDCVVYNYYETLNDGIKSNYRLELHIIVKGRTEKSLLKVEEIRETINNLIITKADNKLTDRIRKVYLNGGGQLTDDNTDTIHQFIYYDILYVKEKER